MSLTKTIGIEVHALLNTEKKLFSASSNENSVHPNSNISLVDIGYPGSLPQLNEEAIDKALKIALALNCKINKYMHFDRKNYFYTDNPKNYQITQNETPIGYDGYLEIYLDGEFKKIEIERIHIEEDTAKSIHEESTLLDYNRAGSPLVEIVTKPVIKDELEAACYLETLKNLLLSLDVSDCKIELGGMRFDTNVSVSETEELGQKVEVKNIGSIYEVRQAILNEAKRQEELLLTGNKIDAETRRFDSKTNTTVLMRKKEALSDYRYHREPDIPPVILSDEKINEVKSSIEFIPIDCIKLYKELGLNDIIINAFINNKDLNNFYMNIIKNYENVNKVALANICSNNLLSYLNDRKLMLNEVTISNDDFVLLIDSISTGSIMVNKLKDIFKLMFEENKTFGYILETGDYTLVNDESVINEVIIKLLDENKISVKEYQEGKDKAFKYLMGMLMKESKGKFDPKLSNGLLVKNLDEYEL